MANNTFSAVIDKRRGFTLIEMLLVLVIVSMFIVMGTRYLQQQAMNKRIDRTSLQMQQILNASLAYYVSNGSWPQDITALKTNGFLPNIPLKSPWGTDYQVKSGAPTTSGPVANVVPLIYVWVPVQAGETLTSSVATVIAGNLPMAYASADNGTPPSMQACTQGVTTCNVVASANVPGQNLNNASAVNYANLYHNGACVPAPQCPIDPVTGQAMTPEIIVAPVSVNGVADSTAPTQAYPINGFTAYALGGVANDTAPADYISGQAGTGPLSCDNSRFTSQRKNCNQTAHGSPPYLKSGKYWRVCLQVVTSRGTINWGSDTTTDNWGQYATVLAFTRCSIRNEYQNASSGFGVWAP